MESGGLANSALTRANPPLVKWPEGQLRAPVYGNSERLAEDRRHAGHDRLRMPGRCAGDLAVSSAGGEVGLGPQAHHQGGVALDEGERARVRSPWSVASPTTFRSPKCWSWSAWVYSCAYVISSAGPIAPDWHHVHLLGLVVVEAGDLARQQLQVELLQGRVLRHGAQLLVQRLGAPDEGGRVVLAEAVPEVGAQPGLVEHVARDGRGCRQATQLLRPATRSGRRCRRWGRCASDVAVGAPDGVSLEDGVGGRRRGRWVRRSPGRSRSERASGGRAGPRRWDEAGACGSHERWPRPIVTTAPARTAA